MQFRLAALLLTLILALGPSAFAAGKKDDKASVSFHMETEGTDNPKMIFPQQMPDGAQRFFRRVPDFNINDVASYNPFATDAGGEDFGIVFTLKGRGAQRFAAISNVNQGRWLLTQLNGRAVGAVFIDQTINDGKIVVWNGVTLADLATLDKSLPRTGEEGKRN
jgi:hypothetical protein